MAGSAVRALALEYKSLQECFCDFNYVENTHL